MKPFINLLFYGFLFTQCSPESPKDGGWDIVLKGKVSFPMQGMIQIQEIRPDGSGKRDTIQLRKDNTYAKKLHLTEPGYYNVNFFNSQVVNVILHKNNVELNVAGNDQRGQVEIKGSPDHELIQKVQALMSASQGLPELKAIEDEYQKAAANGDEAKMDELRKRYMAIMEADKDKVLALLKEQGPSLALLNLLQDPNLIDKDKHLDLYISTLEKFKREWPSSRYTTDFNEMVTKLKITAIGQVAPEIALANPNGDTVKLSSLRGKYVLIDFWAQWCKPCRAENPNVVKAYGKFKNKGFEVYGVSLDRNKEDWLKAIREDGLAWTQVSDLKYFECKAARDYNINGIPFSILLDKNGVIIAKNLRGAALESKLTEVLGKL